MSVPEPFDEAKVVSLWTELFQLQVNIGYYPNADSIEFPPPEGRAVDETLCQELHLTEPVISLLKRLPSPRNFDEAWETPVLYESMAVPLSDSTWIRNARDVERCWYSDDEAPLRPDFLRPSELALVLMTDDPGYHLILDTEANTARFFVAMETPPDQEGDNVERSNEDKNYRDHPARPVVDVLEELVTKFRNLDWIPVRYDGGWPDILTIQHDKDDTTPNVYTKAKAILQEQFGWPDNFDKDAWNRQRTQIWRRLLGNQET